MSSNWTSVYFQLLMLPWKLQQRQPGLSPLLRLGSAQLVLLSGKAQGCKNKTYWGNVPPKGAESITGGEGCVSHEPPAWHVESAPSLQKSRESFAFSNESTKLIKSVAQPAHGPFGDHSCV